MWLQELHPVSEDQPASRPAGLGAKASLIARNEEKLKETLSLMEGEGHLYYVFDLNEINEIDGLIANISEKQGPIDGLVHCAGIGINRPLKLTKSDFVEQMTRINYFAFVELIRAAAVKKEVMIMQVM